MKDDMNFQIERALDISQIYRLVAALLAHPNRDVFELLENGRLIEEVAVTWRKVTDTTMPSVSVGHSFEEFEAAYIANFVHGHRGKPNASLYAGAYDQLLGGELRSTYMLNIMQFYKHFGLKAGGEEGVHDEPDHISTMFEFLSWVSFLQARAMHNGTSPDGPARAERDFLNRYMGPFCDRFLQDVVRSRHWSDLDETLRVVIQALPGLVQERAADLEAHYGPFITPEHLKGTGATDSAHHATAENMWG